MEYWMIKKYRNNLFSSGKPRPLGGVRVNWLCLETTPNGVLE